MGDPALLYPPMDLADIEHVSCCWSTLIATPA